MNVHWQPPTVNNTDWLNGRATSYTSLYATKYIPAQPTTEVMRLLSYSWLVLQHKGAITIEVFKTSNQSISQQK